MSRSIIAGFTLAAVLVIGGCGGGGSKQSATSSASAAATSPSSAPDIAKFCTAMTTLSNGYTGQSAEKVDAVLQEAEANAPTELRADVVQFATNSKAVTAAAFAAGGTSSSFDSSAFIASLSAEQQQFVRDLAAASKGAPPNGYVGRVIGYSVDHCGSPTSS